MIAEEIETRATALLFRINELFKTFPRYQLNLSWPNFGTLDLLSRAFRGKGILDSNELLLLDQITAYVAVFLHDSWKILDEKKEISVSINSANETEITVKRRPLSDLRLNLSRLLSEALVNTDYTLVYNEKESRRIARGKHRLSHLVCRLLGEELKPEKLAVLNGLLATQCAYYYQKNFPSELAGGDPALYAQGLILPPFGFEELPPGLRASGKLWQVILGSPLTERERVVLLKNLTLFPDEQISSAALPILMVLDPHEVPALSGFIEQLPAAQNILALRGESFQLSELPEAVRRINFFGDLTQLILRESPEEELFQFEKLAFIPEDKRVPFLISLESRDGFYLQLLACDLAISGGMTKLAAEILERLLSALPGRSPQSIISFYSLSAKLKIVLGEYEEALRLAERAESAVLVLKSLVTQKIPQSRIESLVRENASNPRVRLEWARYLFLNADVERAFFELKPLASGLCNDEEFFLLLSAVLSEYR
jgi:hypothetical protein